MADHLVLFKSRHITFDLGNLVDDNCTAPFYVSLTAVFSSGNDNVEFRKTRQAADVILPTILAEEYAWVNNSSAYVLPTERATYSYAISSNVRKTARGQAIEDCWRSNALRFYMKRPLCYGIRLSESFKYISMSG